jgi:hypothetical protein
MRSCQTLVHAALRGLTILLLAAQLGCTAIERFAGVPSRELNPPTRKSSVDGDGSSTASRGSDTRPSQTVSASEVGSPTQETEALYSKILKGVKSLPAASEAQVSELLGLVQAGVAAIGPFRDSPAVPSLSVRYSQLLELRRVLSIAVAMGMTGKDIGNDPFVRLKAGLREGKGWEDKYPLGQEDAWNGTIYPYVNAAFIEVGIPLPPELPEEDALYAHLACPLLPREGSVVDTDHGQRSLAQLAGERFKTDPSGQRARSHKFVEASLKLTSTAALPDELVVIIPPAKAGVRKPKPKAWTGDEPTSAPSPVRWNEVEPNPPWPTKTRFGNEPGKAEYDAYRLGPGFNGTLLNCAKLASVFVPQMAAKEDAQIAAKKRAADQAAAADAAKAAEERAYRKEEAARRAQEKTQTGTAKPGSDDRLYDPKYGKYFSKTCLTRVANEALGSINDCKNNPPTKVTVDECIRRSKEVMEYQAHVECVLE